MQFEIMQRMQQEHTKVKHNEHAHLDSPQKYLQETLSAMKSAP